MKNQKVLIRRTFLQERFDILRKKQREGHATFADLTELDWIVNRDPALRERIIDEMQGVDSPPENPHYEEMIVTEFAKPNSLIDQLRALINRLFTSWISTLTPAYFKQSNLV